MSTFALIFSFDEFSDKRYLGTLFGTRWLSKEGGTCRLLVIFALRLAESDKCLGTSWTVQEMSVKVFENWLFTFFAIV